MRLFGLPVGAVEDHIACAEETTCFFGVGGLGAGTCCVGGEEKR